MSDEDTPLDQDDTAVMLGGKVLEMVDRLGAVDRILPGMIATYGFAIDGIEYELKLGIKPMIQILKIPDYKSAWEALSEPLSWMQESKQLSAYLGWNLADIANDLIDRAYPDLRSGTPKP